MTSNMTDTLEKLQKYAPETLHQGEEFVAAAPVGRVGSVGRRMSGIGEGGILGMAAQSAWANHQAKQDAEHLGHMATADVHFGQHGLIAAATNQRFLVFRRSMTGKPEKLEGEWPVDGVNVEANTHKVDGIVGVDSLRFLLPDHTLLAAECLDRKHGDEAEQLVVALQKAA